MRSHILPRKLCLLLAFFIGIGTGFSEIKLSEKAPKTAENKEVSQLELIDYYFNNPNLHKDVFASETEVIGPRLYLVPTDAKKAGTNQIEENSYKIEEKSSVGKAVTAQQSELSVAKGQTLFKQGLFYGFAIMVVLLNLVCYFIFEEKIFLFYSLVLTFVTTSFMHSDQVFQLIGFNAIENTEAMQSTLLLIATIFGALFASKYLTLEEFYPKLKIASLILIGLSFMMVFTGWIVETTMFTGIANVLSLSVMTLYFLAGVFLFSKKNYAKFYVVAYSIPILFSIDYFVFNKLGIDFLFTQSFHLKAAAVVEMLIITYAIMYRMGAMKDEHVLRQTEMRIFLKRQEVINRTSTQKLMQDIYLENLIMQYDLDGFEIKLLQYISEGKDNIKIARKLKTTELEIEASTKELYNKLEICEHIQEDFRMVESQPDYIYN